MPNNIRQGRERPSRKRSRSIRRDTEALDLLGEMRISPPGRKPKRSPPFQRAIQASTAAGQKPDEDLIKRAVAVAYDAKSPAAARLCSQQWVAAYPSPDSWSNSIAIYSNLNQPGRGEHGRPVPADGGYRIASNSATNMRTMHRAAADQNNYNEAQAALDAGIAAKVISPTDPAISRARTTGRQGEAKATAADLATATKTAVSGMALLRIGDRYYAMGDYAKAVELYRWRWASPAWTPQLPISTSAWRWRGRATRPVRRRRSIRSPGPARTSRNTG